MPARPATRSREYHHRPNSTAAYRARRAFTVVFLGVALSACGADAPSPSAAAIRDSAGVRIVENSAPIWGEGAGWHLSEQPLLEIGVLEGAPEYQLFRATAGVRVADGRIVVANAGTYELRVYDSDGGFVKSVGGEGGGPGEFKNIGFLARVGGDSLLTFDWRNNRAQLFDPQVGFVRSFRLESGGTGENARRAAPVAPYPDGSILTQAQPGLGSGATEGLWQDSVLYLHHDREGALIDSIVRLPGSEYFVQRLGESVIVTMRPFGKYARLATHAGGLYFGIGETYEIRSYSTAGALQGIIRVERPTTPVTAADIDHFVEERLAAASDEWRPRLQQLIDDVSFPDVMPAYSELRVDGEGNLWVADYQRPGEDAFRWNVFDPEGRWLGGVPTPPGFQVFEIGSDYVLGRHTDELDVERVQLYRLEKGTAVTRR